LGGPIVYADYREEKSGIPALIEEEGIIVVRKSLPAGDYVVSGDIGIERKTAWDFAHSLFDGRLFDQARRLSEEYEKVIYIVEGDPFRLGRYRSRHRQMYAAIIALTLDYDVHTIYTGGPRDTAYVIVSIARRIIGGGRRGVIARGKGKLESITDQQYYVLQSFPGIGPTTADRVMERFRNLREFCNATMKDLSSIEGIGPKRAEAIFTVLNRKFERFRERKARTLDEFYNGESDE